MNKHDFFETMLKAVLDNCKSEIEADYEHVSSKRIFTLFFSKKDKNKIKLTVNLNSPEGELMFRAKYIASYVMLLEKAESDKSSFFDGLVAATAKSVRHKSKRVKICKVPTNALEIACELLSTEDEARKVELALYATHPEIVYNRRHAVLSAVQEIEWLLKDGTLKSIESCEENAFLKGALLQLALSASPEAQMSILSYDFMQDFINEYRQSSGKYIKDCEACASKLLKDNLKAVKRILNMINNRLGNGGEASAHCIK